MDSSSSQLNIRATLTLRHDAVISAREKLGMTQLQAAEESGLGIAQFRRIEVLDFSHPDIQNHADRVAIALDIPLAAVLPEGWEGSKAESTHVKTVRATRDYLPDVKSRLSLPSPLDVASQHELKERIQSALGTLSSLQRDVLKLRYGIGHSKPHTLEEVGRIYKITRERVRQFEAKAIRRLQHPNRSKKLESFVVEKSSEQADRERCSIE